MSMHPRRSVPQRHDLRQRGRSEGDVWDRLDTWMRNPDFGARSRPSQPILSVEFGQCKAFRAMTSIQPDGADSIPAGFFSGPLEGWNAIDFEKQNNAK
jgi:hypothetical protein